MIIRIVVPCPEVQATEDLIIRIITPVPAAIMVMSTTGRVAGRRLSRSRDCPPG
jgi:hypothetical protein